MLQAFEDRDVFPVEAVPHIEQGLPWLSVLLARRRLTDQEDVRSRSRADASGAVSSPGHPGGRENTVGPATTLIMHHLHQVVIQ